MKIDRSRLSRFTALRLFAPDASTSPELGDRRSPFLGRGLEFADYRSYDPADDLRLVDWNVYQRLGQVLVRQFHEERNFAITILVDVSASMGFGTPRKADRAAELAAALATLALHRRDPVTLCTFGGDGPPNPARATHIRGLGSLVELLELQEPGGHGDPHDHLAIELARGTSDRTILISDLLWEDADRDAVLGLLASSRRNPTVIHVLSQDELTPHLEDLVSVVDGETGETFEVREGADAARAYQRGLEEWLDRARASCRAMGIEYLRPPTSEDVHSWVYGMLRSSRIVERTSGTSA